MLNKEMAEEEPVKSAYKKRSVKDRQIARMKKYIPDLDEEEAFNLLDDQKKNVEDLRLLAVEADVDPKTVYNGLFSKKLLDYIKDYQEEVIEEIDDSIENAKDQINEILDDVKDDATSITLTALKDILALFVERIEELGIIVEDQKGITKKFDEMVDDMENKMVEAKFNNDEVKKIEKNLNAREQLGKFFKLN